MILGIVGSTTFKDKNRLYFEVNELRKTNKIEMIVSGEAPGTDTLAKEYAKEHNIKYKGIPVQWDDMREPCFKKINSKGKEYNALAGFNRNTDIVNAVDTLLAFWVNKSPGTRDSILKAKKAGKTVIIKEFFK